MIDRHGASLQVTAEEHAPACLTKATQDCKLYCDNETVSPGYVTFTDDPAAAAEDIAADVAELLDKPVRFYTAADLAKLDKPAFRIVVDYHAAQRLRAERRV